MAKDLRWLEHRIPYLSHVLDIIANHPINRADELLPWNRKANVADKSVDQAAA